MPFTRDPLDYPINQLLLKVGMALQISLFSHPPIRDAEARRQWEKQTAAALELDQAVEAGMILSYHFRWRRHSGQLRTIRLVPHPKFRRTPGIARIKSLFFRRVL